MRAADGLFGDADCSDGQDEPQEMEMFAVGGTEISKRANQGHRGCFVGTSNSEQHSLGD